MPIDYRELGRAVFAATRAEQFDATLLQRIDEYVDQGYTPSVSAVAERLLNDFKVVQQQGMNDNQATVFVKYLLKFVVSLPTERFSDWFPILKKFAESQHIPLSNSSVEAIVELLAKDSALTTSVFTLYWEQRERSVLQVLLAFAEKRTKPFFWMLSQAFQRKSTRTQAAVLLVKVVAMPLPFIQDLSDTPLIKYVISSLLLDDSMVVYDASLRAMLMLMPRLATKLVPILPALLAIFVRSLRLQHLAMNRASHVLTTTATTSPRSGSPLVATPDLVFPMASSPVPQPAQPQQHQPPLLQPSPHASAQPQVPTPAASAASAASIVPVEGFEGLDQWDTLVDTSGVRSPEVYAALSYQAFTMIYGLFPINTVQYLRRVFGEDQELDLAKPILVTILKQHCISPTLVWLSAQTERDPMRFTHGDPDAILRECLETRISSLADPAAVEELHSSVPSSGSQTPKHQAVVDVRNSDRLRSIISAPDALAGTVLGDHRLSVVDFSPPHSPTPAESVARPPTKLVVNATSPAKAALASSSPDISDTTQPTSPDKTSSEQTTSPIEQRRASIDLLSRSSSADTDALAPPVAETSDASIPALLARRNSDSSIPNDHGSAVDLRSPRRRRTEAVKQARQSAYHEFIDEYLKESQTDVPATTRPSTSASSSTIVSRTASPASSDVAGSFAPASSPLSNETQMETLLESFRNLRLLTMPDSVDPWADPILAQQALRPNEKPSKARRVLIGSKAPAPESISTKDADKSSDPSLVQRNVQALQREVLVLSNELIFERYLRNQYLQHVRHLNKEKRTVASDDADRAALQEKIKDQQNEIKQLKEKVQSQKSDLLSINTKHDNWEVVLNKKLDQYREDYRGLQSQNNLLTLKINELETSLEKHSTLLESSEATVYRLQSQLHAEEPQVAKATEYKHRIGQLTQQLMMWEQATEQHEDRKHELDLLKHRLVEYEQMSAAHVAHEHEVKASEQQATLEASDLRLRLQQLEEKDRLRDQTIHELRAAAEKQKRVMQAQIAAVDEKYRSLQHINQALEHRFVELLSNKEQAVTPSGSQRPKVRPLLPGALLLSDGSERSPSAYDEEVTAMAQVSSPAGTRRLPAADANSTMTSPNQKVT